MKQKKLQSNQMTITYTNGKSYHVKQIKDVTLYENEIEYSYTKDTTLDELKETHDVKATLDLKEVAYVFLKTLDSFADTHVSVKDGEVSMVSHHGMKQRLIKEVTFIQYNSLDVHIGNHTSNVKVHFHETLLTEELNTQMK